MKSILTLLIFLAGFGLLSAEPTEERTWTSTANTTIEGQAVSLTNGQIQFQTTDGRTLKVPLNKLIGEDQAFLKKHFAGKLADPPAFVAPTGLPFEAGAVEGPVDTGTGSTYFVYIPKSLPAGQEAPLLFWTSSIPTRANALKPFIKGAELTGMIVAGSVQSHNANKGAISNVEHSGNCLKHLLETLPIDSSRVIFCGRSGGGATAFSNADKYDCSGVFTYNAYIPNQNKPSNGDYVFAAGGAWDFNRYASADAAKQYGKNGTHRLYPGGHKTDLETIPAEGMCWLYTRELYDNLKGREDERLRFEHRFLGYLREELMSKRPHQAYYWTDHLLNLCEVDGPLEGILEEMSASLANEHQRYLEGRKALVEFSRTQLAKNYNGGTQSNHTTSSIESASAKLATEFQGVIEIEETALGLGKRTATP